MPEHQQTQQSKTTDNTSQKQINLPKQITISHPAAIIQRARINLKSLTPADVLQLQRTIGNRAVGRLLSEIGLIPSKAKQAPPVQMKKVPEEEEKPLQGKMAEPIQHQEISESREEEPLQGKFENEPEQEFCPSYSTPLIQKQEENCTGMPDNLKAGVESLSKIDMSNVKVHYNSDKPVQLNAHAFAQGIDIHLVSGQEKHLPHEVWHVVQQKKGLVKPAIHLKGDVSLNTDIGLEREADVMGSMATKTASPRIFSFPSKAQIDQLNPVVQRLPNPLTPEDKGKIYEINLGSKKVRGRFDSLGLNGLHNFTQVGGEDNGKPISVHYVNIINEVPSQESPELMDIEHTSGREFDPERMFASGREIDPEKMFASGMISESIGEVPHSSLSQTTYFGSRSSHRKQSPPKRKPLHEQRTELIVYRPGIDMTKIYRYLTRYEKKDPVSIRARKEGQRFELHIQDSEILRSILDSRQKRVPSKKYIDASYHETVQYINAEYEVFCAAADGILNSQEMRIAYDILLSRQLPAITTPKEIQATGPSPLTTMTPSLLSIYQDMHYRTALQIEDVTSSTRAYEAQYTQEVPKRMPLSHWRPFFLPEESSQKESSMVNAIGAPLDVQAPTSGKTIGQGKIYSAIYIHFKRSMELLNQHLDKQHGKYSTRVPGAFEKRTKHLSEMLDSSFLSGLYKNEEESFDPASGFDKWADLSRMIDTLVVLISASLDNVPKQPSEDFQMLILLDDLKGNDSAIVKQFELIGTIIGLMIKKEKRQLLNYQILGMDQRVEECLENLYELRRVESELNKQIPKSKYKIGQLQRQEQQRRNIRKELR